MQSMQLLCPAAVCPVEYVPAGHRMHVAAGADVTCIAKRVSLTLSVSRSPSMTAKFQLVGTAASQAANVSCVAGGSARTS